MLKIVIAAAAMVAATAASAENVRCIGRFNVNWGYAASGSGQIRSGQTCATGFASFAAQYSGFRVVQNPANGSLKTGTAGSGAPTISYTPKKNFTGADTFIVDVTAATANRTTGQISPPATSRITYTINVQP